MNILDLIETKKRGGALSDADIDAFVAGVTDGSLPDYQIAALLMAIRLRGMTDAETARLTLAMADGGARIDLSGVDGVTADKHSTGGVGDDTTFVAVPLLALLGFRVAKLSGRALDFTGGTIDKLECFGCNTALGQAEFLRIVNTVGACVSGATGELAPADKRLYALRDVTGTVDSIPLIASSVLSKKLAAGARILMLDVKVGDGAFMQDPADAIALAETMTRIGRACGRKTGALVTSMAQPLATAIGCNLECRAALDVLRGARNDLYTVSRALVRGVCALGARPVTDAEIDALVDSGRAFEQFVRIVEAQGGRIDEKALAPAPVATPVTAPCDGYVNAVATRELGRLVGSLGGGRRTLGSSVDHAVGVTLSARLGDRVQKGETLAVLYTRAPAPDAAARLRRAFSIGAQAPVPPLVRAEFSQSDEKPAENGPKT